MGRDARSAYSPDTAPLRAFLPPLPERSLNIGTFYALVFAELLLPDKGQETEVPHVCELL